MIGARDMAFPRLNAFGFWMFLFGGLLLYFSFLGGDGLYGAGTAPDVGWFAYAPLTARAFSRGNSTDYWIARHPRQRRRHASPPPSTSIDHDALPCAARA